MHSKEIIRKSKVELLLKIDIGYSQNPAEVDQNNYRSTSSPQQYFNSFNVGLKYI